MQDRTFNRAKSDLKFIECAANSVAVIAGRTVYADVIENEGTGIIYDQPNEFADRLKHLIENIDLRARLTRNAYDYVAEKRLRSLVIEDEAEWYKSLIGRADELEAQRRERLGQEPIWRDAQEYHAA